MYNIKGCGGFQLMTFEGIISGLAHGESESLTWEDLIQAKHEADVGTANINSNHYQTMLSSEGTNPLPAKVQYYFESNGKDYTLSKLRGQVKVRITDTYPPDFANDHVDPIETATTVNSSPWVAAGELNIYARSFEFTVTNDEAADSANIYYFIRVLF